MQRSIHITLNTDVIGKGIDIGIEDKNGILKVGYGDSGNSNGMGKMIAKD